MNDWRISILIISHNSTQYLHEAIASAKAQTLPAYEIIVVGDTDHELVDYNVGDIRVPAKFNAATFISKGNAIVHLCEDDKLDPEFLERTVLYLNTHDIVYTDMRRFGAINEYISAMEWTPENMKISTVPFITSLVTKEMYNKVGGYDPATKDTAFSDWDFWWRCMDVGAKAKHIKEPLFLYRIHPNQDTNLLNLQKCREETLKRHLK